MHQVGLILVATLVVYSSVALARQRQHARKPRKTLSRLDVDEPLRPQSYTTPARSVDAPHSVKNAVTFMHELGISMVRLSPLRRRPSIASTTILTSEEYDKKTDLMHEGRNQGGKLVVVMVGLPGRGKSYMARKVARYLNWINYATRVFNIGNYRRKLLGAEHGADFFDPNNPQGKQQRMEMAEAAMEDMLHYLGNEGEVAIYDGTNSTLERRLWIQQRIAATDGYHLLFIESICDDEAIIERNIIETKLRSPDYRGVTPEMAVADFRKRIANYRKNYEALGPADEVFSYVKVIDAGTKLVMNRIHGYLPMKILSFVSNLHIVPRPIYLSSAGESMNDLSHRLGGEAELTPRGVDYSEALSDFLAANPETSPDVLSLWYSTAASARATAKPIKSHTRVQWRALRPLEAGAYSHMTLDEFKLRHSNEHAMRRANRLWYRYPLGESYVDVITRLEPVIFELERSRAPVLLVAHPEVVRCLYGYFLDLPLLEIPKVAAPLHELIELHMTAYECVETRHCLVPIKHQSTE
ncbi:fructose-2,6-bisphosphate 2-phosphatase [Achlya hypogyna]|uniref:Fructose-2,6-bisphosphate 2-phosphatase n=1 Tax=Achlya hypogyna TaxID=1202772 RepID=A0A1V9Z0L2_ACHHY|nr:fructose-2,6-bisphosphate 2-phosphatase [Achlya hypogyna]